MRETINWHTMRKLPKEDKDIILSPYSVMAEKVSAAICKTFRPVMFVTRTREIVPGRYFFDKVEGQHWWSLQARGYSDNEVCFWSEMPKGPKL